MTPTPGGCPDEETTEPLRPSEPPRVFTVHPPGHPPGLSPLAGAPLAGHPPGLWTTPVRGRVALSALGWVLAYAAGVVVVIILGMVAAREAGAGRPPAAALALVVLTGTALSALVAIRVHLLRRRGLRWGDLGLTRPSRSPFHLLWQIPVVMGAAVTASALVLALLAPLLPDGGVGDDSASVAVGDLVAGGPVFAVLGLLTVAVLVPVAEEVVFRGIVLPAVRARYRALVGIPLAGAVFAAVHLVPPALPYLLVVGIALFAMAEWYRSIVPGIVLYGVNNAAVFVGVVVGGGGL